MSKTTTVVLDLDELEYFTAEEFSAMTKGAVSAYTLVDLAKKELIPASKLGRSWRWTREDMRGAREYFARVPKPRARR